MNLWNDARGLMAPLDPHHRQQDGSDCVCVVSCYQRRLDWLGLQANVVIDERFIEWSTTITWNGYVPLLVIGPIDHDEKFFHVDTSSGESWLTHWCSYLISNNAQVHMCLCWDDRRRRRVNKRRCRRRGCPIPMESATAAAQPRVQATWWCIQYKRVLWIWQKGKMSKPDIRDWWTADYDDDNQATTFTTKSFSCAGTGAVVSLIQIIPAFPHRSWASCIPEEQLKSFSRNPRLVCVWHHHPRFISFADGTARPNCG